MQQIHLMKSQRRIHQSEYTNNEWYYRQLAEDWYIHTWEDDYLIMRKMTENGYGDITAQQASVMKYATIWELDRNQIRILLGREIPNWDEQRQQPLEEYRKWLSQQNTTTA